MGPCSTARVRGWRRGTFLAAAVAATALGGAAARAQLQPVGTAKNAVGVLVVTRTDGRSVRLQGKGSLDLFEGDKLETGEKAQAIIELKDGTQIALNERTTFVVLSRQPRGGGIIRVLDLLLGEIWVQTRPGPPAPLEVTTPVATAAIRSTEFNIKIVSIEKVELVVVQGIVEFGTPFGTCPIRTGTFSVGERGKRCTRPDPNVDVQQAIAWTTALRQP